MSDAHPSDSAVKSKEAPGNTWFEFELCRSSFIANHRVCLIFYTPYVAGEIVAPFVYFHYFAEGKESDRWNAILLVASWYTVNSDLVLSRLQLHHQIDRLLLGTAPSMCAHQVI